MDGEDLPDGIGENRPECVLAILAHGLDSSITG